MCSCEWKWRIAPCDYAKEEKLPAYARIGITEFWLVNLVERVIEVYREPSAVGNYSLMQRARQDEEIALAAFPEIVLTVSELLG